MKHYAWTHIEAPKKVNYYVDRYMDPKPVIHYRGKIKLHGTNAAVQINKNGIFAQSRNNIITPENDNVGFATWVHGQNYWKELQKLMSTLTQANNYIVYGEWAGPGIMKGTSVSNINKRIFAVFAIRVVSDESDQIIFEPEEIKSFLSRRGALELPDDVHILPWGTEAIEYDFNDHQSQLLAVQKFNEYVEGVEETDPWVKETFGVDGNGEGYVFYPLSGLYPIKIQYYYEWFSNLVFKAKGNKHKKEGASAKTFVKIDPEILENINEFVDMYVTVDRLEQAVREGCNNEYDVKKTGDFLKWINSDVQREGLTELEANGLEWKSVAREVSIRARKWWMDKCKEI